MQKKARLILQVSPGVVKIQMAKNWMSQDNPNGKSVRFKLVNGAKLFQDGVWYREE